MASILCKCNQRLSDDTIPNDIQHWVYTDKKKDAVSASDVIEATKLLDAVDYDVWLCPNCKRLWVFEEGKASAKYLYKLEETFEVDGRTDLQVKRPAKLDFTRMFDGHLD